MIVLAALALALAALYAGVTFSNLAIFRPPAAAGGLPVPTASILIPARDEEANIAAALAAAAQSGEVEIVVLDDGSTDATARIVGEAAARDPRIRLLAGAPLPPGWNGKQHACWQLAQAARNEILVFVDADVRLAPDAVARLLGHMERAGLDLVSGFPRQLTRGWAERLVIPEILVVLLGYLPLAMARRSGDPKFGTACGQLIAARRNVYMRAGGHAATRAFMHDGLRLPRLIRGHGGRTDIVDATPLASCRMYEGWAAVWHGFSKNATEGMATPGALPVWTLLLGGGHLLPYAMVPAAIATGHGVAAVLSLLALGLMLAARIAIARLGRQGWVAVVIHPAGILVTLAIQWTALLQARRGRRQSWRGRTYDAR